MLKIDFYTPNPDKNGLQIFKSRKENHKAKTRKHK